MSSNMESLYDQIIQSIRLGGNDFDRVIPLSHTTGAAISGADDSEGFTFAFYYPQLTFDPIYKYGRELEQKPPLTFEQSCKLEALMTQLHKIAMEKYGKVPYKEYPVHGTAEDLASMLDLYKALSEPVTAKAIQNPICQSLYQILTAVRIHNRGMRFIGNIGDFYGVIVSITNTVGIGDEVNLSFRHGGNDWLSITGNESRFSVKSIADQSQLDFEKILVNVRKIAESVKLAYPEPRLHGEYFPEGIVSTLLKG